MEWLNGKVNTKTQVPVSIIECYFKVWFDPKIT